MRFLMILFILYLQVRFQEVLGRFQQAKKTVGIFEVDSIWTQKILQLLNIFLVKSRKASSQMQHTMMP